MVMCMLRHIRVDPTSRAVGVIIIGSKSIYTHTNNRPYDILTPPHPRPSPPHVWRFVSSGMNVRANHNTFDVLVVEEVAAASVPPLTSSQAVHAVPVPGLSAGSRGGRRVEQSCTEERPS